MKNILEKYVGDGALSVRTTEVNGTGYDIYCYTKDQFFNKEWDEVTIGHRGKIYRDDGTVINNPFPKIFNLNEQPETNEEKVLRLIQTEKYEVLDKLNGHLVIVSHDRGKGNVLVSTKGSFGGDLADLDRKLVSHLDIDSRIKHFDIAGTFMFECIAKYDQHLFFENHLETYDLKDDSLVLLGAILPSGESVDHDSLKQYADFFGVKVTKRFTELEDKQTLKTLFEYKNIEGFVFHFPRINFRFKVKTTEYVALHYMKDVTAEKLVNHLYNSGIDNMYRELDEELYPIIDMVKEEFKDWYTREVVDKINIDYPEILTKRQIALSKELTPAQKAFLFYGMPAPLKMMESKNLRHDFKMSGNFPKVTKICKEFFEKRLYSEPKP